jgi:hypothetical protein
VFIILPFFVVHVVVVFLGRLFFGFGRKRPILQNEAEGVGFVECGGAVPAGAGEFVDAAEVVFVYIIEGGDGFPLVFGKVKLATAEILLQVFLMPQRLGPGVRQGREVG